ncbi:MAG: hypothetical protein ABI134_28780 [Byssovorax sp.]
MELLGVPPALRALFPAHEFYSISKRPRGEEPFDSFTSSDKALTLGKPNGNVDKIIERMVAGLVPGPDGRPPDLLVVLEDLEPPNLHQPALVVQIFRDAIARHMEMLQRDTPRLVKRVEEALRPKASFHLAVPMIEAWLFADPNGPRNAGAPAGRLPPNWERARDPEAFLTRDPVYLADDCSACTAWHTLLLRKKKDNTPGWLKQRREVHPKAFLAWLCRDPAEHNCSRYRETHEGAAALGALDFSAALRSPDHCTYLRALVEDLADGLGEELSLPTGGVAPSTSHRERRASPSLRNI